MSQAPSSASGFLLENALIMPRLGQNILQGHSLAVIGNRIAAIGTQDALRQQYQNLARVDLQQHLLCPGLINAHTHASMSFFRGIGQSQPASLDPNASIIENFFYPIEKSLTPDLLPALSMPYLVDALRTGTTAINDAYFFIDGVGSALETLGMRGFIAEHMADLGGPHPAGPELWKTWRHRIEHWDYSSRVQPVVYAHATDTVSPGFLQELGLYARRENLPFHMHLSQTFGERDRVQKREGMSPVAYAKRAGVLFDRALLVHLVSADASDMALIREANATAVLCPVSEIIYEKLPNLSLFLEQPQRIALGTDCAASNDGSDLWDEARILSLLQRDKGLKEPLQGLGAMLGEVAGEVLAPGQLGILAPGRLADLVCIKLEIGLQPLQNPLWNLIFTGAGRFVQHVMIDGRWVLWQRDLCLASEADLKAQLATAMRTLSQRTGLFHEYDALHKNGPL